MSLEHQELLGVARHEREALGRTIQYTPPEAWEVAGPIEGRRNRDVVAQLAVVRHVRVLHEESVRTDHRRFLHLVGSVHRAVFAKHVVVADAQAGRLVPVFQILRRAADHAAGVKLVARADGGLPGQMNMRPDPTMRPHHHILLDDGVGTDDHGGVQLRFRVDDSRGVDHE